MTNGSPSLQWLLAVGTLCCGAGCCTADIINFISALPSQFTRFEISFWLLSFDILLLASLLAYGSLMRSSRMLHLFGFLQYTAGTGVLLMLVGSLVTGMAGNVGLYFGVGSIIWGGISCFVHCATKGHTAPTNEPLMPSV